MIGWVGKRIVPTKDCAKNSIKFSHKSAQYITLLFLRCLDITKLDNAELEAMDKAIFGVTDSLSELGFDSEDFIKINCAAFNVIRGTIGLSELTTQQFQEIYFAAISGQSARFFKS